MALVSDYRGSNSSTAGASSYTFAAQDIGTASAGRFVLVGIIGRAGTTRTISGVTIGGVSASQLTSALVENVGTTLAFWGALVPTGATGDIVVTTSGGSWARCIIGVWALTGLASATPANVYTDTTFASGALSVAADCPAGGGLFGLTFLANTDTWTWAGITERFDVAVEGNDGSGASLDFASAQSGLTVSSTRSASGTGGKGLLVVALSGADATAEPDAGALVITGYAPVVAATAGLSAGVTPKGRRNRAGWRQAFWRAPAMVDAAVEAIEAVADVGPEIAARADALRQSIRSVERLAAVRSQNERAMAEMRQAVEFAREQVKALVALRDEAMAAARAAEAEEDDIEALLLAA